MWLLYLAGMDLAPCEIFNYKVTNIRQHERILNNGQHKVNPVQFLPNSGRAAGQVASNFTFTGHLLAKCAVQRRTAYFSTGAVRI